MINQIHKLQQFTALTLILLLGVNSVSAGILVVGPQGVTANVPQGITATGVDGVAYNGTTGITATGVDGFLGFYANGITATGVDGITATGVDGITATGVDGVTYTGANGITATGVDGVATVKSADGITATGVDGTTVTGVDGTVYKADSVLIRQPTGITATGVDGITATGVDGITATGVDGITATGVDGITATGVDGITATGVDGITATGVDGITVTGVDGKVIQLPPGSTKISGTAVVTVTAAKGVALSKFAEYQVQEVGGGVTTVGDGLQSVDPELALLLSEATDDSNVNAIIVYHRATTDADILKLTSAGVLSGTRYKALPMVAITATRQQIMEISKFREVRSIYGNRTLQLNMDRSRVVTGVERARQDTELKSRTTVTGRGVAVAVLDTGINATHSDLAGRVVRNVKVADTLSAGPLFPNPVIIENLSNTDLNGHGTFVAGIIAGSGDNSGGKFSGVASGAQLVGVSVGELNLLYVLAGFDYLLEHGAETNVRVVNCSFSANTVYDTNDPVNVATKLLTERNINVVFSAGNSGPGMRTLNPYAVAPWVISVGATNELSQLANFSSRGSFGSNLFRPTLVAPGVNIVSVRSPGLSTPLGIPTDVAARQLPLNEALNYTAASGTSFSAPQVAGTIALMLEANPNLTPAQIRDILARSATPLPYYYQHEVGAGMLNAHAALLEAAFARRMGRFRATLNRGQVTLSNQTKSFSGTVSPGGPYSTDVWVPGDGLQLPADALLASVQIAWGGLPASANNLNLAFVDPDGQMKAEAGTLNVADNLLGLTGKRKRVAVEMPTPTGKWNARVNANLAGTAQSFLGASEVVRAKYPQLEDINNVSPATPAEVYQNLRSFVMWPIGKRFRPGFAVTRLDLVTALVLSGRVPQYLPRESHFSDVRDESTMIFVESARAALGETLFNDAAAGGKFSPDKTVDRLTAAVALVRAAGLQAEADKRAGEQLPVADANKIPTMLRGYVAVALDKKLLVATSNNFNPESALTRAQLAHAMVGVMDIAKNAKVGN